jgi:hypothetical protein
MSGRWACAWESIRGSRPWSARPSTSVIGLLIGVRHLALNGQSRRQLRPARLLLAFSGAATLALNVAEPVITGAHGRAAFDAVGPLLLIGWSEVGPGLLHQIYAVRTATPDGRPAGQPAPDPGPEQDPVVIPLLGARQPPAREQPGRPTDQSGPMPDRLDDELMPEARRIDAQHRTAHQRPVSAETLRRRLRIGTARARRIVADLRSEGHSPLVDEAAI